MPVFVPTPTLEQDGFQSLYDAYRGAFPAGTTVPQFRKAVLAANGISDSVGAIERWIFGVSGKRFPFDSKNNPGLYAGGPKNVGWSYFGQGNVIKLPDFPRPGLSTPEVPAVQPALSVKDSNAMLWVVGVGGALWLLVLALGGKKKKQP